MAAREPMQVAAERQIKTLNAAIDKVGKFLATHEDKIGKSGKPKRRDRLARKGS